jgi:hypothetical protein
VSRVSSDGSACAAIVLTIDMCSTTIADLVVALGTGQIKTGAPCRSERVAKVLSGFLALRYRSLGVDELTYFALYSTTPSSASRTRSSSLVARSATPAPRVSRAVRRRLPSRRSKCRSSLYSGTLLFPKAVCNAGAFLTSLTGSQHLF